MLSDLAHNNVLLVSIATWIIVQVLKVIIILVQERRVAWNYFVTAGGMPSSHSATVCALCTSIAITSGLGSVYFSIAFVLAVIVMYDAAGVRQSVGQQSVIINRIVKTHKLEIDQTLREFIGHTHLQVLVGALLGILISWTAFTLIV